jgi:hypothetical protein
VISGGFEETVQLPCCPDLGWLDLAGLRAIRPGRRIDRGDLIDINGVGESLA